MNSAMNIHLILELMRTNYLILEYSESIAQTVPIYNYSQM